MDFRIGPWEGVLLGANFGRATVTNGDFTAYVCDSETVPRRGPLPKLLWADLFILLAFNLLVLYTLEHKNSSNTFDTYSHIDA